MDNNRDEQQLVPMLEQVKPLTGSKLQQATANAGYFSESNVTEVNVTETKLEGIELRRAPGRN
jgi:hypothetical protein